jgi:hypothetical protein
VPDGDPGGVSPVVATYRVPVAGWSMTCRVYDVVSLAVALEADRLIVYVSVTVVPEVTTVKLEAQTKSGVHDATEYAVVAPVIAGTIESSANVTSSSLPKFDVVVAVI